MTSTRMLKRLLLMDGWERITDDAVRFIPPGGSMAGYLVRVRALGHQPGPALRIHVEIDNAHCGKPETFPAVRIGRVFVVRRLQDIRDALDYLRNLLNAVYGR